MKVDPTTAQAADILAIRASVEALQRIYAVILALALCETFKQFVRDDSGEAGGRGKLHWDRLPALIVVVVLIVPFFHGMQRYFHEVYLTGTLPSSYGAFILVDTAIFMLEGILFFVLARSLRADRWRMFYRCVLILLSIDIAWGTFVACAHSVPIWSWVLVNLGCNVVLILLMKFWRKPIVTKASWIFAAVLILRTIVDYGASWRFYFP